MRMRYWGRFRLWVVLAAAVGTCGAWAVWAKDPHPAVVRTRRCVMQNCVLDASGWHASAGTMGIMLVDVHGMLIRNCTFRNMPEAGNHDQGGIDFEAHGNGCLVEGCTFENNAGAAIEVLGLKSPQITNLEIRGNRFLKNNWADKLGPAEVLAVGNDMLNDVLPARETGFRTALFAGDARSLRLREGDPRLDVFSPDLVLTDLDQLPECLGG